MTALTLRDAQAVLANALERARQLDAHVCIAVVDAAGVPVTGARMDGASFLGPTFAASKAFTAAGLGMPTHELAGEPGLASHPGVCLLPGGVPIKVDGHTIGGVGVAGAPGPVEIEIAAFGIKALTP